MSAVKQRINGLREAAVSPAWKPILDTYQPDVMRLLAIAEAANLAVSRFRVSSGSIATHYAIDDLAAALEELVFEEPAR